MSERTHSTENYWGSTITLDAAQQVDGTWSAVATVQPAAATETATTVQGPSRPTAVAAIAAARALATAQVDAQRVGQGKP